ncbi:MAG: cobalamin B12-binding domain-containing protein [Candidatus Helarchaeota archaeon]
MSAEEIEKLKDAVINFEEEAEDLTQELLGKGASAKSILEAMSNALEIVGQKYESHEYFLSELMLCGDVAKKCIEKAIPMIQKENVQMAGTIVFGTVKGDIHDIGKTIVSSFLIGAGFLVHDIGTEVDAAKFVKNAKEKKADIVALSALLSTTMQYMPIVIQELKKAGVKAKIIVGGRPVNEQFAKEIGADGYGKNPTEAIEICRRFMDEIREGK